MRKGTNKEIMAKLKSIREEMEEKFFSQHTCLWMKWLWAKRTKASVLSVHGTRIDKMY